VARNDIIKSFVPLYAPAEYPRESHQHCHVTSLNIHHGERW